MSINPVISNYPATSTALTNKYTTGLLAPQQQSSVLQALNRLPLPRPASQSNIINPMLLYDMARANRGMMPLTARQSAAAARTLATGKPATPPRREGFFRSAIGDLRAMVSSIPKLPGALIHEATQLDDAVGQLPQAIAEGSNPIQALGNVANLPGFRMVPGAFVAGAFGDEGQGVQQLLAHPLFTALDVLPLAQGIAKSTRVARTAEEAYRAQVNATVAARTAEGLAPGTAVIPNAPRPLQTALTRTVDEAGNVVPNMFGRGIQQATDAFTSTTPGNLMQQAFRERLTSRVMNRADTGLREAAIPEIPTANLRLNIPSTTDTTTPLAIRDLSANLQTRLKSELERTGMTPDAFYNRVTMSELPDGTPLPPEQMLDLSPELRAIARETRDLKAREAAYTSTVPGGTREVGIGGVNEVFDQRTAQRLSKLQRTESVAREMSEARQAALATADSPSPLTVEQIDSRIANLESRADIPSAIKRDLTQLYQAARENADFGLRDEITRAIPVIRTLEREYKTIPRLIDHLKAGRWGEANRGLRALARTRHGRALPLDLEEMQARISGLVGHERALSRTSKFTPKYAERKAALARKAEAVSVPARFDDLVQSTQRESTRAIIRDRFSTAPDLDSLIKLADEGIYDHLSARDPEFASILRKDQAAARATWQALRDAGHDPIFMQRVTPQQAARQPFIRVADHPTTLQSVKARMMDATPYVRDVGVILNQAQLDILQQLSTDAALTDIATSFGRTRASLIEELTPRLLKRADSEVPMRSRLDAMIRQRWEKFDPASYGGGGKAVFSIEGAEDIYIPRAMAANLKRMYEVKPNKLSAVIDPVTKAFRTSVLPFALRWHLNNTIGGAIVTAINDPRAFLELPDVIREMWGQRKNPHLAAERIMPEGAPPSGFGMTMGPDRARWDVDAGSPIRDRIAASAQFASGSTLRKLYDQARDSRLSAIPEGLKKFTEASYGVNQFVDDIYRASLSRSSMKRLMGKGWSEDAAEALTVQSLRRSFQAWDDMTPMERSVMRSVVPFYGFAAWATKFVLRYPLDHPLRASILGSITRAELTDAMTGLPEYIRDMILLGDPRANSTVKALNLSPFNPFGGVPSMFTVAGFTGQLNPVISGVLESIGVDTRSGGPLLYPELRYDPETGRMVADPAGNVVSNILGNTIPQLSGISALLGWNDEFNDTLKRDPSAAGRMLFSNFGLPVIFRKVNVGDQLIKSELARLEDQDTARKEALRTGNLGILNDFPGLAAYGEQLRQLEAAGQLDAFRPTGEQGQPGIPSQAGVAYAAQAALTGS